jgi:hypothetical protein
VGPLRLGRLLLRSWRPYVMLLPVGYNSPFLVYLVEAEQEDGRTVQLGAFTTQAEAKACLAQLASEGYWQDLEINFLPVHERVTDWQWDR